MDVDVATRRTAVKELMTKWVEWERETKKVFQEARQALYNEGEIAAALELDQLILDVDDELIHAEKKLIKLESIGYDITEIIDW
jgi:hypothetical protein